MQRGSKGLAVEGFLEALLGKAVVRESAEPAEDGCREQRCGNHRRPRVAHLTGFRRWFENDLEDRARVGPLGVEPREQDGEAVVNGVIQDAGQ